MPADPAPRRLRGCAVGSTAAGLAVAAHGVGGGGFPDSTALTMLLIAGTAIGAAATTSRVRGPLAVIGMLGAGQIAGHLALTLALHHDTAAGGSMLAAHLVATLVCAVLIVGAERLCATVTTTLAVVSQRIDAPPIQLRFTWIERDHLVAIAADPRGPISRRGPPA